MIFSTTSLNNCLNPLLFSCKWDNLYEAELLLLYGAHSGIYYYVKLSLEFYVDYNSYDGYTSLHYAVPPGVINIVNILLEYDIGYSAF